LAAIATQRRKSACVERTSQGFAYLGVNVPSIDAG
jgi:hypothetical protein